jgi:hypothetical protein
LLDFPRILKMYEKLIPALKPYMHYMGVSTVILAVEDATELMKLQVLEFKKIYKEKGKIDEQE